MFKHFKGCLKTSAVSWVAYLLIFSHLPCINT